MKFLIVLALIVGANAHGSQQTRSNDIDFSNILVRVDEGVFGGSDAPLYPPLAPPPPSAQTFRLVPAADSGFTGGNVGQPSGFDAPPTPVTSTQILKLRRVGGGSTGGYASGASAGYAAPPVPQSQTFTLRKVEQDVPAPAFPAPTGGFGGQASGFGAPIPATQVASFTLRQVEGGQSSYASQRSDYGGASSYASQASVSTPQVQTLTLRRVSGGGSGGSFQGQSSYASQRSDSTGGSAYAGQGSSMPFGSEYIDQVFKLIEKQ